MSKRPSDRMVHEIDLEVRYKETDQMGVVHHSNYLVWFELARTALCQRNGPSYAEIEAQGYWLMVTGVHVDYRAGARYGDTARVAVWVERSKSRILHFGYEVYRLEPSATSAAPELGAVLVRGTTEHTWVNATTGRVCRVPEPLQAGFQELLQASS